MKSLIIKLKKLKTILFGDSLYVPLLILFMFWTGLGPPSAMLLALNSKTFSELEHMLLLMSFSFVLPISLIQLMFMEKVFPKKNREILKEIFMPVLLVLLQSLLTEISFFTAFIMINLSTLSSRLLGHMAALIMEPFYNKKLDRNLHEHLSLASLYVPMLVPVVVFSIHIMEDYSTNTPGTSSWQFSVLIISFMTSILLNARSWYYTFKLNFINGE